MVNNKIKTIQESILFEIILISLTKPLHYCIFRNNYFFNNTKTDWPQISEPTTQLFLYTSKIIKIKFIYFANNTIEDMHDIGFFFITTSDLININKLLSQSSV